MFIEGKIVNENSIHFENGMMTEKWLDFKTKY